MITNIYRALKVNIGEYPMAAGEGMLSLNPRITNTEGRDGTFWNIEIHQTA